MTKILSVVNLIKGELPYYMLPDIVRVILEIPLTANGKVNYNALPDVSELFQSTPKSAVQTSSAESSTSVTLKTLLAEAFGLPDTSNIDARLTFMEQGAHSFILVKFVTLITQKTSCDVTIADIFSYPTICALEELVTQESETYDDENTHK